MNKQCYNENCKMKIPKRGQIYCKKHKKEANVFVEKCLKYIKLFYERRKLKGLE